MKKFFLVILSLLMLTGCRNVNLNPEWYPNGIGRDHIYLCKPDGKFYIMNAAGIYVLGANTEREYDDMLLAYVDYYTEDDKLYACSSEGFAVVDEVENTVQVFVRVEEQYFTTFGTKDDAVTYLTSFDEFSKRAQEIFLQMDEYTENRKERYCGDEFFKWINGKIYPSSVGF